MHHELPAAANSKLEHLEGVREAVRSPPAREQFGLGEGFKDSLCRMAQHPLAPKDAAVLFSLAPRRSAQACCSAAARSALTCCTYGTSASTAASIPRSVVSITGKFNASACPRRYAAQLSIREFESSGCPRGPASRAWRTGGAQSSRTIRDRAVWVSSIALRTNDGRVWPSRTYTSAPSGSAAKRSIQALVVTACQPSRPPEPRYSADGTPTASK
jgi:hypothetical protein